MIDVNIYKEKEEGWEFLLSKSVGIKYEEYKKNNFIVVVNSNYFNEGNKYRIQLDDLQNDFYKLVQESERLIDIIVI